jgi:L-malate glycosyltransferase
MRYVLFGDGESPHLLKWTRALAAQPGIELWAASSRGFLPGFDVCIRPDKRLALNTQPRFEGGNAALLRQLPTLARWLRGIQPQCLHAHYLTSHGTLAWLAQRWLGVPGRLVGSAWGSDILVTPGSSAALGYLTQRVLRACVLTTSDSQVMAQRMREMGAREVMTFPFGLEKMPPAPPKKDPHLFFANRGLEPIYAPERVLQQFAAIAGFKDRLLVANEGSLLTSLREQARSLKLTQHVQFVGRLDAAAQAHQYATAGWYLSLPTSDSVSVSVLEAMAHGCMPILSDLPANHELVRHGDNGLIVPAEGVLPRAALDALLPNAKKVASANRTWVQDHALFGPSVRAFLQRLQSLA